jgi:hypothetical protein
MICVPAVPGVGLKSAVFGEGLHDGARRNHFFQRIGALGRFGLPQAHHSSTITERRTNRRPGDNGPSGRSWAIYDIEYHATRVCYEAFFVSGRASVAKVFRLSNESRFVLALPHIAPFQQIDRLLRPVRGSAKQGQRRTSLNTPLRKSISIRTYVVLRSLRVTVRAPHYQGRDVGRVPWTPKCRQNCLEWFPQIRSAAS